MSIGFLTPPTAPRLTPEYLSLTRQLAHLPPFHGFSSVPAAVDALRHEVYSESAMAEARGAAPPPSSAHEPS